MTLSVLWVAEAHHRDKPEVDDLRQRAARTLAGRDRQPGRELNHSVAETTTR